MLRTPGIIVSLTIKIKHPMFIVFHVYNKTNNKTNNETSLKLFMWEIIFDVSQSTSGIYF